MQIPNYDPRTDLYFCPFCKRRSAVAISTPLLLSGMYIGRPLWMSEVLIPEASQQEQQLDPAASKPTCP
jgi:hypothetical protein